MKLLLPHSRTPEKMIKEKTGLKNDKYLDISWCLYSVFKLSKTLIPHIRDFRASELNQYTKVFTNLKLREKIEKMRANSPPTWNSRETEDDFGSQTSLQR